MQIEVINLIEIKQKLNDQKHFKVYSGEKIGSSTIKLGC